MSDSIERAQLARRSVRDESLPKWWRIVDARNAYEKKDLANWVDDDSKNVLAISAQVNEIAAR